MNQPAQELQLEGVAGPITNDELPPDVTPGRLPPAFDPAPPVAPA